MHEATEEYRKQVKTLAMVGTPQPLIARVIGISVPTLARHYRDELDLAVVTANSNVAMNLYRKATGNGPNSHVCAMFWLKCRAGWKETQAVELTGADGGPIETRGEISLSKEEYRELAIEALKEY